MSDNKETKPIEPINKELDIPPTSSMFSDKDDLSDLTPTEKLGWKRRLQNLDFLKYIISLMLIMYLLDFFYSAIVLKKASSLQDPFFEALKTILFTVAGFVFGKSSED